MNENHRKVLEMLAQGKVTVTEAERLMEKLSAGESSGTSKGNGGAERKAGGSKEADEARGGKSGKPKFLRVVVETEDGDDVNVRLPMALIRTGVKLGALMPKQARQAVEAQGVDLGGLSDLNPEDLTEALADLTVDVCDEDGNTVKIFCE